MISIFTCTARGLRKTLESMATPCSVNAFGNLRVGNQLLKVKLVLIYKLKNGFNNEMNVLEDIERNDEQ